MGNLAEGQSRFRSGAKAEVAQYVFGPFRLDLSRRALYHHETRIRLGSRALAILIALLERPNQLVTKQELVQTAWPTTFVEEGALRVHVAALRRALGDRPDEPQYILNVMGQGYQFVADVDHAPLPTGVEAAEATTESHTGPRLIGRDADADILLRLMTTHQLVSLVGPWGVGKSALAAHVAPSAARIRGHQLALVDASSALDASDLYARLKAVIHGHTGTRVVFIDNCDAHIPLVAEAVEEALHSGAEHSFLVTSTEPLRAAGERVFRLPPLATPMRKNLTLGEALAYPAVKLLAGCIRSGLNGVPVLEPDTKLLLALAERLDGYPLAIEMAATEVQFLGLRNVAERVGSFGGFKATAPSTGKENPTPRETTYHTLNSLERNVIRRLSIFGAAFALDDAISVCVSRDLSSSDVVTSVTNLALKSYLTRSRDGDAMRYRMPGHLRSHLLDELQTSNVHDAIRVQHAAWVLTRARNATVSPRQMTRQQFMELNGFLVDDYIRAADFATSSGQSAAWAASLLLAVAPTLLRCNQHSKTREFAGRIIASPGDVAAPQLLRLRLLHAVIQEDLEVAEPRVSLLAAETELLEGLRDDTALPEALVVDAALLLRGGQLENGHKSAMTAATHAHEVGDRALELTALRLSAECLHYSADHKAFAETASRALKMPAILSPLFGFVTSHPPSALAMLRARECWLAGRSNEALIELHTAMTHGRDDGPWARSEVIALGLCPVLYWRGDVTTAEEAVSELSTIAIEEGLPHWSTWSAMYQTADRYREVCEGRRSPINQVPVPTSFLQAETWSTLTGRLEALNAKSATPWCKPEIMRLEALALLSSGDHAGAEEGLLRAQALSRDFSLAIWELRCSITLAKLWRTKEPARGADVLAQSLAAFSEGLEASDIVAARALQTALRS